MQHNSLISLVTVVDSATFEEPLQFSDGVRHVVVNGEFIISNGKHTGARAGAVLRRGN